MDLSDLPDELQAPRKPSMSAEERAEKLLALGSLVGQKRDEAVKARKDSGIEEVWMACEDAYLGIDDTNRHEFAKAKWAKSTTMQGPLTANTAPINNKSTAYVRLTTRYVDMGAAKISDIVLPIDDKAFTLDEPQTPDPVTPQGQPTATPQPTPAPQPSQPGQPTPVAQAVSEFVSPAKKAEQRIYDWMVQSRYPMQMRKVIHDSARIGVGVLKGPYPDLRTSKSFSVQNGAGELAIESYICPAWKWIDPWNLFPHGSCGEDIHDGDYIFERDFLTANSLRKLKDLTDQLGKPIYLPDQIDKVLQEGPDKINLEQGRNPNDPEKKSRFTIWHFTGTLNRDDMVTLEAPGAEDLPDEVVDCYCILTLVNDTIIRATFNPLEKSGNFPYRAFPWSRRAGHWAGVGVAEQVSLPQRMVNAGTRAWMNNAGNTAGMQLVMDRRAVIGADGNHDITPNKVWEMTGEGVTDDVRKVFMAVEFPDRGKTLQDIIQYAFKMAEEMSNIPLVSQGQTGPDDPQTFGQAELQNSNANTLLRDKAYTLDDFVTEPTVNDAYEWLMLDPDVPDDEKGSFTINARGSIAMVEKAIQEQTLAQLLPLAVNPVWGQDPEKLMSEFLRSKRMNPKATAYTDAQKAQMQQTPPPTPPQVQVAQINAAAKLHGIDMQGQQELQRIAAEAQHEQQMLVAGGTTPHEATAMARIEAERIRATSQENIEASRAASEAAYAQTEAQIARDNAAARHQEIMDKRELAILQYALANKQTLEQVKADLAKTAMQEQTKRLLAGVDTALQQSENREQRSHDMAKHVITVQNDNEMRQAEANAADQTPPESK